MHGMRDMGAALILREWFRLGGGEAATIGHSSQLNGSQPEQRCATMTSDEAPLPRDNATVHIGGDTNACCAWMRSHVGRPRCEHAAALFFFGEGSIKGPFCLPDKAAAELAPWRDS